MAAMGANIGVVVGSPRLRRAMRTILWLAVATWIILTILHLMRAEQPTATVAQQKWLLESEESKYMAAEGHLRRARAFTAVVGRMMVISSTGNQFTRSEVQQYLGPPGLYYGPMDRPDGWLYFYNQYGKKNWVYVLFDSTGKTRHIGWNVVGANTLTGWSTYPTTLPATTPATAKP